MSAAAIATPRPPKRATNGWCRIPNSLIENSRGLTGAEYQLAMIVCRKNGESALTDENWAAWTGLSERTLEYAVAGLMKKGLLTQLPGKAKYYSFETANWQKYVESLPPAVNRPKTEGRKPVKPVAAKPGAMVHPECAHECALLKQDREETRGGLHLIPGPVPAQPVARKNTQVNEKTWSDVERIAADAADSKESPKSLKQQRREMPPLAAQPVAQIDQFSAAFPQSLRTLQAIYAAVGPMFLAQLVTTVRASGFDVDDEELTTAIQQAHNKKRRYQTDEGLFLLTVPEQVRIMRADSPKRDMEAEQLAEIHRQHKLIQLMMSRVSDVLRDKGFDKPAARLDELLAEHSDVTLSDMEKLESQLVEVEREIVNVARAHMTKAEKSECAEMVERCIAPWIGKLTEQAIEDQRRILSDRGVLNAMGIPRLGLLYV